MVLLLQSSQGATIALFIFIPFLIFIALLIVYIVRRAVKNTLGNPKEPFEQAERKTIVHLLKTSSPRTRLIATVTIVLVAVAGIIVVGQLPVHRTNIEHSDPLGDVADADIDIVEIRSYLNGTELYLQLTVAGRIVKTNATTRYQYKIIPVAKRISEDSSAHIYELGYTNGSMAVSSFSARAYVNGATLTIVVPISMFSQGEYMIGLEGIAQAALEQDFTPEDRDGEVAHLWF